MGMTIEEAIAELELLKKNTFSYMSAHQAFITAIDTMYKYQKIKEILNSASYTENGTVYSYTYDEDSRVKHIREVVEDETN